jgi:hypothetical protein
MFDKHKIDDLLELLVTHRHTLHHLLVQAAQYGGLTLAPPQTYHGITYTRTEIRRIKASLRELGVAVPDEEPPEPTVVASASQQLAEGLQTFATLLASPEARTEVAGFHERLKAICRQIDQLNNYKTVHDLLHELQFKCYGPIVRGARDFPHDMFFLESLVDYEAELKQIVNSLWDVFDQAAFLERERECVVEVSKAADLLSSAIKELNKELLDRAVFQIGRVLYKHPIIINERLKKVAADLRLSDLVQAMDSLRNRPEPPALELERLYEVAREAIEQLQHSLDQMLSEHDIWQGVDLELRQLEDPLELHLQQLEWLWPDLKAKITPLCQLQTDRWAQDLRQAALNLEQALAAQSSTSIIISFRTFRHRVGWCFYQTDKKLKDLCSSLRQVDGPLNSVVSMLA